MQILKWGFLCLFGVVRTHLLLERHLKMTIKTCMLTKVKIKPRDTNRNKPSRLFCKTLQKHLQTSGVLQHFQNVTFISSSMFVFHILSRQ